MTKEIQERLDALFEILKTPRKDSTIDIFKTAVSEMMDFVYQRDPSMVQTWLDDLGAVEWQNYITRKEAEAIISKMVPAAPWTIEQWERMIETNELNREEAPYYNPYALFVVMSTIYADHAQTLAKIMGQAVDDIPENEFFKAVYTLALDRLKKSDTDITVRNWYNL